MGTTFKEVHLKENVLAALNNAGLNFLKKGLFSRSAWLVQLFGELIIIRKLTVMSVSIVQSSVSSCRVHWME